MKLFSGKLLTATEQNVKARWSCKPPGEAFRCGLCGHKFQVGDRWRGVMANTGSECRHGNFLVCKACHDAADGKDGPLLEKRAALEAELHRLHELGLE